MSLSLSSSCNDNKSNILHVFTRVIYDRVRNRKNYFEIPAFFMFERGNPRAGKFKLTFYVLFICDVGKVLYTT